jgi:hypothetical protein
MKKNKSSLLSVVVITAIIFVVFYFMMPQSYDKTEATLAQFSTKRALKIVKNMSEKTHFVGSENHDNVAQYLQSELQNLGLETSIQVGFTMTEKGTLVKSKNILTKIKGTSTALSETSNSKALVLLSHYDSAPHSFSYGASDDASGIATILESVRAFMHTKSKHKNDIIILFTDAEELGLNGAALFVTEHLWAKEVGVVLNFEARGTSGPSYMLMETNNGNAKMVEAFCNSNVTFPATNSLMYSIYKMLPNDTDLTVFREKAKIQGFNFAFIDNHFNYHTAQDTYKNLNPNTLAHQGSYIMPLLSYLSNADLSNLNSTEDKVYFNIPFQFISYPFSWIIPMVIIAFVLFVIIVFFGLGKKVLEGNKILRGIGSLFASLIASGIITFFGWKLVQMIYPQYNDILQGFTYNGHDYIYAFVSVTLGICFLFFKNDGKRNPEMSQMVAPLFVWLLLNIAIAFQLKGAAFLIIPVISSLLMLGYFVMTQKSNSFLNLLLSLPTLFLIVPFIQLFPIGLGLKILVGSAILTVLCFTLLLPIFGNFAKKEICASFFILIAIGFFVKAHLSSNYEKGKAKPNSLDYVLNGDTNKAYWATYDKNLDNWTKEYLSNNPKDASILNTEKLYSKYGSQYTYMATAEVKNIAKPTIDFVKDSIIGNVRNLKIVITPNRKVNRYDLFSNSKIKNFKANGVKSLNLKSNIISKNTNKILSYYVVDNIPLTLEFSIPVSQKLDMNLVESSFDLMSNSMFKMKKRKDWMMPTPFVLTDAVIIKEKVKPSLIQVLKDQ